MSTIDGELERRLALESALAVEDWYRAELAASRRRDAAAGRTLNGPQASDLAVRHGPKNEPARACSTGEQKALLMGLTLAHARLVASMTGQAPLVLLDEVAAHFDVKRREALYDELEALGGQVWDDRRRRGFVRAAARPRRHAACDAGVRGARLSANHPLAVAVGSR